MLRFFAIFLSLSLRFMTTMRLLVSAVALATGQLTRLIASFFFDFVFISLLIRSSFLAATLVSKQRRFK